MTHTNTLAATLWLTAGLALSAATTVGAQTAAPAPAPVAAAPAAAPAAAEPVPFALNPMPLPNGTPSQTVSFASANPVNYEDILSGKALPPVTLEAKLYLPRGAVGKQAVVIIAPGSGGVAPPMLAHASALTDAGLAVLLMDPFGGRGVKNTIAAQDQFSFAASTYDIFSAMKWLAQQPQFDAARMGAMGYSRGGISVLQAALQPLARQVLGQDLRLKAVLAGWPWCGYQFQNPQTAPTAVRMVMGDVDNWVSGQQCQGYADAMRAHNPHVSTRMVRDALHGFGYGAEVRELPTALKALNAPTLYFAADGKMLNPWSQQPESGVTDTAIVRMFAPFLARGVTVGSKPGQAADFAKDFIAYFAAQLK